MKIQKALDWIIPLLNSKGIPFHITGGFSAHLYGATRPINDIDIDLPTAALNALIPEVSKYLDFGPKRHVDSSWDLYVATLNYNDQLIDLTGAEDAYIFNKSSGSREPIIINFNDVVWVSAFNHRLPLQNPQDLMNYKLKLGYDEDKHLGDIAAIQQYLLKSGSK